jgi:hypothetical protein
MKEMMFKKQGNQTSGRKPRRIASRILNRAKEAFVGLALLGTVALASCTFDSPGMRVSNKQDGKADVVAVDADRDSTDSLDYKIPDTIKADAIPQWWNTNWKYCREVKITGNIPAGFANGVLLAPSNFSYANAKTDLADLRFVEGLCNSANSGKNALPAWVQNVDPANGSRVWFKTQSVNVTNVAMYYGNAAAANVFDGDNVFVLFDSFNGSSLDASKWTCKGTCIVTGGSLEILNKPSSGFYVSSQKSFGTNHRFTVRASFKGSSNVDVWDAYFGFRSGNDYILWAYDGTASKFVGQRTGTNYTTSSNSPTDNKFHIWSIRRNAGSADYYYDGALLHNLANDYPINSYPVILHTNETGVSLEADWIFVRVTVTPGPTYSIGSELNK